MRYFVLLSVLFSEIILAENETTTMEFVPIGKDTSAAIVPVNNKPIESTVVSHKVFKEDGIKYTEIVRRTPSGGIQTSHIKGTVNPSILPVTVPNLSGLMSRIQTRIASRMEVSSPPRKEYYPPDMDPLGRADGPIYHRTTGFEPLPRHPYPPPPYPPMMMYPPSPDSLMGRVGSMTGNILDNVMEFVMGRRR